MIGLDSVFEVIEKVQLIWERLRTSQSRQKAYMDVRRKNLEFGVSDLFYLKISLMKGLKRFGKKEKFHPCYFGPYRILRHFRKVAYELELLVDLASVHPVFHFSLLKNVLKDSFSYKEIQVEILDVRLAG